MPVVTHNDLDGIVSAFLACYIWDISFENVYTFSYAESRDNIWKKLRLDLRDEPVIFTDISFNTGELEWVGDKRSEWIWIDHHVSSLDFEPDGIFDTVYLETSGRFCAANLVAESLEFEYPRLEKKFREWVDIAKDRDLWANKNRDVGMRLDMIVRQMIYKRKLSDLFYDMRNGISYCLEEYAVEWEQGLKRYSSSLALANKLASHYKITYDLTYEADLSANIPVVISYVTDSQSDVADALYETGSEIIALINVLSTDIVISLRTKREDVDLSWIAKDSFSGGGHKQASGGKLNCDILERGYYGIFLEIEKGYLSQNPSEDSIPF